MNCKKYQLKAEKQKTTWIPKVFNNNTELEKKMTYFHVRGEPSLKEEYCIDNENNILLVKVEDDYNSLPKKVVASFQAITNEFPHLKYIFKTDDDQELKNPKFFDMLIQIITKKQPKLYYGGHIVKVPQGYISQYHRIHPELPKDLKVYPGNYCTGRFYFLYIAAIQSILKPDIKKKIEEEYLADYAIGQHLEQEYKVDWRMHDLPTELFFCDYEKTNDTTS
jgi:hypothetical protein